MKCWWFYADLHSPGCLAWWEVRERLGTIGASLSSDICHLIFRFTFCLAFFFLLFLWCHIQLIHLGDALWTRADKQVVCPENKTFRQSQRSASDYSNWMNQTLCCSENLPLCGSRYAPEQIVFNTLMNTFSALVRWWLPMRFHTTNLECTCSGGFYHRVQ